jgi:hypothetical protein
LLVLYSVVYSPTAFPGGGVFISSKALFFFSSLFLVVTELFLSLPIGAVSAAVVNIFPQNSSPI